MPSDRVDVKSKRFTILYVESEVLAHYLGQDVFHCSPGDRFIEVSFLYRDDVWPCDDLSAIFLGYGQSILCHSHSQRHQRTHPPDEEHSANGGTDSYCAM
jgi:hypothetical protein